jgi:hypothetical protein
LQVEPKVVLKGKDKWVNPESKLRGKRHRLRELVQVYIVESEHIGASKLAVLCHGAIAIGDQSCHKEIYFGKRKRNEGFFVCFRTLPGFFDCGPHTAQQEASNMSSSFCSNLYGKTMSQPLPAKELSSFKSLLVAHPGKSDRIMVAFNFNC